MRVTVGPRAGASRVTIGSSTGAWGPGGAQGGHSHSQGGHGRGHYQPSTAAFSLTRQTQGFDDKSLDLAGFGRICLNWPDSGVFSCIPCLFASSGGAVCPPTVSTRLSSRQLLQLRPGPLTNSCCCRAADLKSCRDKLSVSWDFLGFAVIF